MMASSEETFVVLDSSKFGRTSLVPFAGFEDFDYLLVDSLEAPELADKIQATGIKVITCNTKS